MPGLGLAVVAGGDGLGREVRWLHASELADPTPWMSGGELLLTTGLGMGTSTAKRQKAYLRRLAEHRLAGLGFGLGFGHEQVPAALVRRGGPARVSDPDRALRGALHRDLEGGLLPPRERAARDRDAGARGARAPRPDDRPRPGAAGAAGRPLQPPGLQPRARRRERTRAGGAPRAQAPVVRRLARAPRSRRRRDGHAEGCARAPSTSASTTCSSFTTARRRSRSSSRSATPSRRRSCGSRATCSTTSSTSGSRSGTRPAG